MAKTVEQRVEELERIVKQLQKALSFNGYVCKKIDEIVKGKENGRSMESNI